MKILHRGKNKIAASVPVYGFGLGPTKTKAKNPGDENGSRICNCSRRRVRGEVEMPDKGISKMKVPVVANDKTTELVTVKLQNNLYLSVVRRRFEIVIVCQ